jgi:hypothetical protein
MKKLYFVLGTPGTSATFIAHLIRHYTDVGSSYPALVNQYTFSEEPREVMTPEFYYNNLVINKSLDNIISLSMKPDIDGLLDKFPHSKIVMITHSIDEIEYIANYFFKTYYLETYDSGASEPFREILRNHSNLFSNVEAAPSELTVKETKTFKKILQYHKLLDGYFNITHIETDNLIKISFSDILYQRNKVLDKISNFTGVTTPETASNFYKDMLEQILDNFAFQRNNK